MQANAVSLQTAFYSTMKKKNLSFNAVSLDINTLTFNSFVFFLFTIQEEAYLQTYSNGSLSRSNLTSAGQQRRANTQ